MKKNSSRRPFPQGQKKSAHSKSRKPLGRVIKKSSSRDEERPFESFGVQAPRKKAKVDRVIQGFEAIWETLWSSPVHLDSALSKQNPSLKSILAQILPAILLRPASQAESLGVGIPQGEPWSLRGPGLRQWRPATLVAERIYELLVQGPPHSDPSFEDFPPEMISEWESSWGRDVLLKLVDSLGRTPPMSIRVTRKEGASSLLKKMSSGQSLPVQVDLSDLSPVGIRFAGYLPILNTEWYEQGLFEIQDEGSQLMALFSLWPERYGSLLQKSPGEVKSSAQRLPTLPVDTSPSVVVDACAGAGGKSLAMADFLKGRGRVYAYDTSEKKLQALRRRAKRAGLNNIQTACVEETKESQLVDQFQQTADVVLVDAPCSGWGVLRRNPDIKWRQQEDARQRMPEIQSRLLSEYSQLVKVGGRLVYGVCTFRKCETTEIVDQFLARHPEFEKAQGGYLGPGPSDGFFMQAFIRKS